jgi:hypothetical protein
MILLTWDPVPDAVKYKVIRKDNNENISKEFKDSFGTNTNDHYYLTDTVAFSSSDADGDPNQTPADNIINGHSYTYTVYSMPNDNGASGSNSAESFIGHGKASSNAVTANVPAQNKVDWIAVNQASIKIERLTTSTENLLVSWDAKPNLKYTVQYYPLADTTGIKSTITVVSPLKSKAYVTFTEQDLPYVKNTISIKAEFVEGTAYYAKTDVKTKDVVIPETGLAAPKGFELVLRKNSLDQESESNIQLTWDRDPYDTVTYTLDRSEFEVGGDGVWREDYTYENITKFVKWEPVTVKPEDYLLNKGVVYDDHTVATSQNKYFVYRLVAKKDGLTSEPVYTTISEKGIFIKGHYYILKQVPHNRYAVTLKLTHDYNNTNVRADKDYGVDKITIYKREYYTSNPQKPYVEVGSFTNHATTTNSNLTELWIDTDVKEDVDYQYRIVVKRADGTPFVANHLDDVEIETGKNREASFGNITPTKTDTSIRLTFGGSYLGNAAFKVQLSTDGGTNYSPEADYKVRIPAEDPPGWYYTLTNLIPNTPYTIKVTSGLFSRTLTVRTDPSL